MFEYIEHCKEGMDSIAEGLDDLHRLLKNYGDVYDYIEHRNLIEWMQSKDMAITTLSIEEAKKLREKEKRMIERMQSKGIPITQLSIDELRKAKGKGIKKNS